MFIDKFLLINKYKYPFCNNQVIHIILYYALGVTLDTTERIVKMSAQLVHMVTIVSKNALVKMVLIALKWMDLAHAQKVGLESIARKHVPKDSTVWIAITIAHVMGTEHVPGSKGSVHVKENSREHFVMKVSFSNTFKTIKIKIKDI